MTEHLISKSDFKDITGAQQPAKICQCLRENGIKFTRRIDGWPSLSWEAYNRQMSANNDSKEDDGFNLEAAC